MVKIAPKLKILYIAGHLSTGGMPEVLRARVESLSLLNVDVWVVEYSLYSTLYTTQREVIQKMLGDRFISLGWFSQDDNIAYNKYLKIRDLIDNEKFDIIHFDDTVETYDTFNKVHPFLLDFIYSSDRSWKVVETVHNSHFNGNEYKQWIPDAFMHCSKYNYTHTFSRFNQIIPTTVIEYPIWEREYRYERPVEFDTDKFNIINVGIWTPGKNQKEAIEIARYLEELYPDKYVFHFIGALAPNFESYWRPIISDLPKNVKIWDVQSEVGRFYQWADLVLFNSTFELNPIVLKEAVSFKKPLLIRNLEIYNGAYDKHASYLSGDLINDALKLQSILHNPTVVDYEFSELNQMGKDMIKFYEQINGVVQTIELTDNRTDAPISFSAQFVNGAFLEIIGDNDGTNYRVEFIDSTTNQLKYSTNLLPYHWAKTSIQYYVDWDINIIPDNSKYKSINYKMELSNKKVLIRFESSSLGDTIAWIPYVDEFRKKHNCIVYCSTFHNNLFIDEYPNINFISPNETIFNLYAQYNIGWFYENGKFDINSHKSNFISQPLQKTASDILGLEYKEIRPLIKNYSYIGDLPKRYFTFSLQSTAQSKYWNYTNGWYELLELLHSSGLVGVCVDKYKQFGIENSMNYIPSNSIDKTGLSLEDTIGVINGAEFHIGLSSGVSWLAWAVGKQVVMISGFTNPDLEFTQNCIRIHNDTVCNGCFSNPNHTFDKSDWLWCPVHKGTGKQFECTKTITPVMVYSSIKSKNLL